MEEGMVLGDPSTCHPSIPLVSKTAGILWGVYIIVGWPRVSLEALLTTRVVADIDQRQVSHPLATLYSCFER